MNKTGRIGGRLITAIFALALGNMTLSLTDPFIKVALMLSLAATSCTAGQDSTITNKDYSLAPPVFTKMSSFRERDAALDLVLETKPNATYKYLTGLTDQVNDKTATDGGKVYAIFLLGEMRATNAFCVEALIAKIDLNAPQGALHLRLPPWGPFPAEEALIKIGEPVVDPILTYVPVEGNELRRHLMCEVLKRVAGKEASQAKISQALAAETDPIKKANLEAALRELEK